MRTVLLASLMLAACGGVAVTDPAPCSDASMPLTFDASPPPTLDASVTDATSSDASDASDASDGASVDCDGDHYRGVCLDTGDPKTDWGFDARCSTPYRWQGAFTRYRLNGTEYCNSEVSSRGFAVLCCSEGGNP